AADHVGARATRLAVDAVPFGTVVKIALQGEAVRCRGLRVQAESAASHVRRIGGVGAGAGDLIGVFRVLAVDTELDIGRRRGAEADARLLPQLLAAAPRDIKTLCVPGGAGNDVDDAIDRVGTPQCAAGTADDFDAVDVFEEVVLYVPEHTAIERRVHGATVDQHQELVGEVGVEAAGADGPVMRVDLRHLQVVGKPQCFGNAGGARAADVLRGDDLDRGGGLQKSLRLLGDGRHLDVHQLLDAQALELARRGGLRRRVGVRLPGLPEQEAR